jgi:hypothetical protein
MSSPIHTVVGDRLKSITGSALKESVNCFESVGLAHGASALALTVRITSPRSISALVGVYFAVGEFGSSKVPVPDVSQVTGSISTAFSVVTNPAGNVYDVSVAQISALVLVNVTVAVREISIRIVSETVSVQGANWFAVSVSSANPLVISSEVGVYVVIARLGFAKPVETPAEFVHTGFAPLATEAPKVVYVSPSHMVELLPALTTVRGVIDMVSSSKTSSAHAPDGCAVNLKIAKPAFLSASLGM